MLFMSFVCHAFASVNYCLVVTCWERADLLALFNILNCVFVTFPSGILNQVWYLSLMIPDRCRLSFFDLCMEKCACHKIVSGLLKRFSCIKCLFSTFFFIILNMVFTLTLKI